MITKTTLLLTFAVLSAVVAQGQCTIQQQTVTGTNPICSGSSTVSLASSETGVYYYLRNNADNSIVDGPIEGTGSAINFITNSITTATTYNVNAVSASKALDFERDITSYITTGTGMSSFFAGTNQITVEAWVNTESYTQQQTIVGNYGPGSNGMQFLLRIDDGRPGFWVNNGGFALVQGTAELPLNTWVHIAATWDGTTSKVYYNGVLVGSAPVSGIFPSTSNELRIGANYPNESFDGKIDNLRIWSIAKTATEINNGKSLCLSGSESNLVALYNFDNITSNILEDLTANNYDGTFVGTPVVANGTIVCSSCSLQMSSTVTLTPSLIAQTTVTPSNTNVVCNGSAVINLASSETGINYYLRNDADNALAGGPVAGTGGAISINSMVVNTNSTFNVYGVKPSSALSFGGDDDYGVIAPSTNLNSQFANNTITVEGWYYITPQNYNAPMLIGESYLGDGTIKYTMYIEGSTLRGGFFNGSWHTTSANVPFNEWIHIACTYDQLNIKLYFNGIQVASVSESSPLPVSTEEWRIGRRWDGNYGGQQFFQGKMDEVRIWNVARTQTQIQAAMDSCLTGSENNLVGYYKFEDGNSTVTDIAGGDQNITLLNFDHAAYVPGRETCSTCALEMTLKPTVTVNPIAQQIISPLNTNVICAGSANINIAATEAGVNYYLRDNADNSIVDGPVTGTGSAINFNTGNVTSNTTYNVSAKKISGALNFDGNNDYIESPVVGMAGVFTFETWIKTNDPSPTWSGIITTNTTSGTGMFTQLSLAGNGTLRWESNAPNSYVPNMTTIINDNVWHHVAVVSSGSSLTFYVDGNIESSMLFSCGSFNRKLLFMSEREMNGFIPGKMDDARIWNVARTQAEIQSSMNACLTGAEPGLEIYYNFENGIGSSIVSDIAGGDQNGTLMNMDPSIVWTTGLENCGCVMLMAATPTVTVNSIANQAISATQSTFCNSGSTSINLNSSETTVNYYLRNDLNDTIIAGPIAGNGSSLSFNTGTISATTTYNVFAERSNSNTALTISDNTYVSVPSGINLANQSFTIEFWAKRNNSNSYNFIIGQGTGNLNDGLHIGFRDNNNFTFAFYGNDLDVSNPATTDGIYHHWSCVYNAGISGTDRYIYLDGNLIGSDDASGDFTGSGELKIGSSPWGTQSLNGQLDEVRIWNVARTQSEIQNNMNSCLAGGGSGLVAYYDMTPSAAMNSVLFDNSGNHLNGTLFNMDPATVWTPDAPSVMCSYCSLEMPQTATVIIKSSTSSTITVTSCDSYIAPDGSSYAASGTPIAIIPNIAGCDSTITINLTIKNSTSGTDVKTACGSYIWIDGLTYTSSSNTATMQLTNAAGCDSIVTLDLTINNVDVSTTVNGVTITADANNASYLWLDCDNQTLITGEISQSFTAIANGNYAAIVTENGCTDTSACINISSVGFTDEASNNNLILSPNPTSGYVTLTQIGIFNNTIVRLMTIDGKVSTIAGNFTGNKWSFDMSDHAAGIYFIEVTQKDKVTRMKVVKN
jgi:hypothetical protein